MTTAYPIPSAARDKHIAFLGTTGSGKTSCAKSGVIESALADGERVVIIDPTGAWWGLRLGRDGKSKGFPIYIFGGDHGDYPLRAHDAETLAEAFAASTDSAIFDTSLMTVSERTAFFTHFAEALRRKNRGPLKVVIDEAHLFMPQSGAKSGGDAPAMLHAANNLVSLGRSRGLRITLISQRPAKIHKDSLTQVQSLVAMRLLAPQDRKAISEWIADQADPEKGRAIVASLPSLKPGEAWVWSPLDSYLERVAFPRPQTFDSSRAPDYADGKGPALAPIDLSALKTRLATIEEETKANDPKALRAEVAKLKQQMAGMAAKLSATGAPDDSALRAEIDRLGQMVAQNAAEVAAAEQAGRERALKGMSNLVSGIADAVGRAEAACGDAKRLLDSFGLFAASLADEIRSRPSEPPARLQIAAARSTSVSPPINRPKNGSAAPTPALNGFTRPQERVLRSLATWKALGHDAPSREMVAAVAGYSPSTGNFNNLIASLGQKALAVLEIPAPGRLSLTTNGVPAMSREEGRDALLTILSGPQRKIVDALNGAGPMSREQLGDRSGYSATTGNFNNLIGSLNTLGISCIPSRGHIALSDWAQELMEP